MERRIVKSKLAVLLQLARLFSGQIGGPLLEFRTEKKALMPKTLARMITLSFRAERNEKEEKRAGPSVRRRTRNKSMNKGEEKTEAW